jgi:prolyl oligopeptidase
VFEGDEADVSVSGFRLKDPGHERDVINRSTTFYTGETYLRDGARLTKLDVPEDIKDSVNRDDYFAEPRTDWTVGGKTYKAGSLVTTKLPRLLAGDRDFQVLFEPTARRSLRGYTLFKSGLLLSVLDTVSTKVYFLADEGGRWGPPKELPVPPLSMLSMSPVEPFRQSDLYRLTVTNYLTPGDFALGTLNAGEPEVLKKGPRFFDSTGMTVSQHFARSKDGTEVPYFQVSPKGYKADGTNPTLLYGYGGFEVSLTPGYSGVVGSEWLSKGGVYVVANIRGGGEFGPAWHQAALKEKRGRAYEDFAAVADDLVKRKVTRVKHLGAMGGSNGGLLMGNMLTQYPDKFGAIVCSVPLLDMRRYHRLLAGNSWMAEYGDPDTPSGWESIKAFSPYHLAKPGVKYPRTLFTTSTRDDRVHPGHARKMVALLKEQGHDVLLYENIEGGHGGAADNKQRAYLTALEYTFLWKQLR